MYTYLYLCISLSIQICTNVFNHEILLNIYRLTETEKTRHFLILREKLGIDKPLVIAATSHTLDKREKEAVNLVARASGEGRAIVRPHSASSKADMNKRFLGFHYKMLHVTSASRQKYKYGVNDAKLNLKSKWSHFNQNTRVNSYEYDYKRKKIGWV